MYGDISIVRPCPERCPFLRPRQQRDLYADDVRKNQDDMDAKQKALADAKQKLDDMQEEARKAGVPASSRE